MLGMKLTRLAENIRAAPLVAAFLLCFAILLYSQQPAWLTSGSDTLAAPITEHSSHVSSNGADGGGHTQTGSYLSASLEEAETSDKQPINAEYLTALLMMIFFGAVLGLLFGGRMWRRDGALLLARRRLASVTRHFPRGPASSRLSVFLL